MEEEMSNIDVLNTDEPLELGESLVPDSGPQRDDMATPPRIGMILLAIIGIAIVMIAYLSGAQ